GPGGAAAAARRRTAGAGGAGGRDVDHAWRGTVGEGHGFRQGARRGGATRAGHRCAARFTRPEHVKDSSSPRMLLPPPAPRATVLVSGKRLSTEPGRRSLGSRRDPDSHPRLEVPLASLAPFRSIPQARLAGIALALAALLLVAATGF